MDHSQNPKSIKYHVRKYLEKHQDRFKGKKVIDLPAGNGITSKLLKDLGAEPYPFDLFPEYFKYDDMHCQRADVMKEIPLSDHFADAIICQEGIEHFSDQYKVLKEFSRVLKKNGRLIITTPNYSNLRARMSYFLSESERFNSIMPPNELDSIWMSKQDIHREIYFGHIFLIGIQKLRVLAKLAGLRLKHIQFTRKKTTSLLMLPFAYPFIYVSNWINYRKNMRKNKQVDNASKKEVYGELFRLNTNWRLLVDGHLFVEFEKEKDKEEVSRFLQSQHESFGLT